ncbi:MAG: S8 family serine peptidase [Planctomycetota bacterium]
MERWLKLKLAPDVLVVFFRRDATSEDRERVFQTLRAVTVEEELPVFASDNPNASTYRVTLPTGSDLRGAFHSLFDDPSISWVDPVCVEPVELDEYPDDPDFPNNSAFDNTGQTRGIFDADIDAPEGWDIWNAPFMREKVAVIDTGIDFHHPELEGCRWVNHREYIGLPGVDDDGNGYTDDIYGWDFIDGDGDPMDEDGHGTQVAGVIAASAYNQQGTAGLCREIVILPIRAFHEGTNGILSLDKAFRYAIRSRVDVINCSFGYSSQLDWMPAVLSEANAAGILVVCTAGNRPIDLETVDPLHFPRTRPFPNIITVTGTDQWDRFIPSFGYGATRVLLAAPGNEVGTTMLRGKCDTVAGTSFSAPQVTGAVALAIGLWRYTHHSDGRPTVAELRGALIDGVDSLPSLEGKCVTGGRLNLPKFLRAFDEAGRISLFGSVWWSWGRLPGVKITLSEGGSRSTFSGAEGTWAFHSLRDGTYTITPSRRGFVFTPASRTVTLRGASEAVPLFDGRPVPPRRISGTVLDGDIPIVGARVTLTGELSQSRVTVPEGGFLFTDLVEGAYDVRVELEGWTFSPPTVRLDLRDDVVVRFAASGIGRADGGTTEALALLDSAPARSRIRLAEAGNVPDLAVFVEVSHDRPSDLRIRLISPDGTPVLLRAPGPGFLHDVNGWYGRDHVPAEPFSRLAGRTFAGDGRAEVALAMGPFPQSGGWVALHDDAGRAFTRTGWARLRWPAYDAASGETWPAFTR